MRVYDTNLSWRVDIRIARWLISLHWWYDRGMRRCAWWPLEVYLYPRYGRNHVEEGRAAVLSYELAELDRLGVYRVSVNGGPPPAQAALFLATLEWVERKALYDRLCAVGMNPYRASWLARYGWPWWMLPATVVYMARFRWGWADRLGRWLGD